MRELLATWQAWARDEQLPRGKAAWRDVFNQTRNIRRWGILETLRETGMVSYWQDLVDSLPDDDDITFQIELFYRTNPTIRTRTERELKLLIEHIGGKLTSQFIDMPEISFHAVKASAPVAAIRTLIRQLDQSDGNTVALLFSYQGVMYFRPTGQSMSISADEDSQLSNFPPPIDQTSPVAAILDGAPNLLHEALRGRIIFDDPDNLSAEYQPGERVHGTAMASLVIHGDRGDSLAEPLNRLVYHAAVMQPDPSARTFGNKIEYFPDDVFFEDRIERAVRRMFSEQGATPPQAPGIKIINLSIGDPTRPFIHTPSPWARLLDWLSWHYRVLFCVSAGNYTESIDVVMPHKDYAALDDDGKTRYLIGCIQLQTSERRLLSPAESLNAITVGATHSDHSNKFPIGQRIDLLPNTNLISPISRMGHGFRRSIKPEILLPGGRQMYKTPHRLDDHCFAPANSDRAPGQQVAWDSAQQGELSQTVHSRGTSNATALATRGAAQIYETLVALQAATGTPIPTNLQAVVVKALLVHGASHNDEAVRAITAALRTDDNSARFKTTLARFLGYGFTDINRVLSCTAQRATVIGFGEIRDNQVHEYRLPLPVGLTRQKTWRRIVVTLAWFSPINPQHRNLREAKLSVQPGTKWDNSELKLHRHDADHNQVLRGTVQHEVLEGDNITGAIDDNGHILLNVTCKKDATEALDVMIPYGLAVTLEVAEGVNIPIYEQIKARIRPRVAVNPTG